jgi:hypothetical protein
VRTVRGKRGANAVKLKLPRARYRVSLVATDAAGNRSARARRTFSVK